MVADRHALRAADIDGVLSRPRFPLINQIHQRLRRRHQIKVMAGPSLAQLRHERRLPCLRAFSYRESTTSASGRPARRPLSHQSLQPGIGVPRR
jgi:hypothetical protein